MRKGIIVILTFVSMGYMEAKEVTEHVSKNDVGVSVIPESKHNKETYTTIYCGYSLSRIQEVTHGVNAGFTVAISNVMFGADFKVTCGNPSLNNHSWGGYGIIGWQGDILGVGMMIGGISKYDSYKRLGYAGCKPTWITNNSCYYCDDYKTSAEFDGGIMMTFNIPTDDMLGLTLLISSTYYSPFSIGLGIRFFNCY